MASDLTDRIDALAKRQAERKQQQDEERATKALALRGEYPSGYALLDELECRIGIFSAFGGIVLFIESDGKRIENRKAFCKLGPFGV